MKQKRPRAESSTFTGYSVAIVRKVGYGAFMASVRGNHESVVGRAFFRRYRDAMDLVKDLRAHGFTCHVIRASVVMKEIER